MMQHKLKEKVWWPFVIVFTLLLWWVDYLTGVELNFFVFYFMPVGLAAWYLGLGASVIISIMSALVWSVADVMSGHTYSSHIYAVWNTTIRLCSFLSIGWSLQRIRGLLLSAEEKNSTLKRTLSEIKILHGLLPICAQCKKIRDREGRWEQMEVYISNHTQATFTHGLCPGCAKIILEEAGLTNKS